MDSKAMVRRTKLQVEQQRMDSETLDSIRALQLRLLLGYFLSLEERH